MQYGELSDRLSGLLHCFFERRFKVSGAEIAQRFMAPFCVIKQFNILKDALLGFLSCLIRVMVHPFSFEAAEESFHTGVVPNVSLPAHTALNAMSFELLHEYFTRVLTASVTVV